MSPSRFSPGETARLQQAEQSLLQQKAVVEVIARVQSGFITSADKHATWSALLDDILRITDSAYGMIGQVLHTDSGAPYLKTFSLTDVAWDAETRALYAAKAREGFEFHNLTTLFGAVLATGQAVLSNDAAHDPRRGGLPPGHPPLHSFLGLPIHHEGELLAMVGVANRPGGYDLALVDLLQPLLTSIGQLLVAARTSEVLAAERQSLAYVLAATGEGIWDFNVASGSISHSARWAELVGYDPQASTHPSNWLDARIHPQDLPQALAAVQAALDGADAFHAEYRFLRPDGHTIWLQDRGRVVQRDAQGQPLRLVGSILDISARKASEAHLELAASVFTHAREGIAITNAQACFIDVNQTFCAITGYSRDEVIGQSPVLLNSGRQSAEFYQRMWQALTAEGFWSGEIWNRRKCGEVYPELLTISAVRNALGQTERYVAIFSDLTQQKENERRLAHVAHFDTLTGLPNRVLLTDRLKQAMAMARRSTQPLAVAFVDLDGFKAINDTHGEAVGDQVLVSIAARLRQVLREEDTVARFGGDEFVAMMVDLAPQSLSLLLVERLLACIAEPVVLGALRLQVSGSIGVTFFPQKEDIDADQLLRQADQAMYQAKLAGKNRYAVFDLEQNQALRGQHVQLQRLQQALVQGEFVLHYQPKVNMRSGQVLGAEALVRWQHPERGLLAPALFLPQMVGHPLEIELGRWVMQVALTQIALWQAQGLRLPVSVNIAAAHLQHPDFFADLQQLLQRHPAVPAGFLELEVLETTALDDMAHVGRLIEDCARIGVGFSLDDFGTGYSTLTYLKQLPAQLLKIDQSFVRDMLHNPDDLAILEGVLGLARAFRRAVIAEGVETLEHGQQLLQLGCELGQGYGIARPMPAADMPGWVRQWQAPALWRRTRSVSPEDLSLIYAVVEHRAWVRSVAAELEGRSVGLIELDPLLCHFGRWLTQCSRTRLSPQLADIEWIHRQLHTLSAELLQAQAQRSAAELAAGIRTLNGLAEELIGRVHMLLAEPETTPLVRSAYR